MKALVIGIDLSGRDSEITGVAYVRDGKVVDRAQVARCAACGQSVCDHSDLEFAGLTRSLALRGQQHA